MLKVHKSTFLRFCMREQLHGAWSLGKNSNWLQSFNDKMFLNFVLIIQAHWVFNKILSFVNFQYDSIFIWTKLNEMLMMPSNISVKKDFKYNLNQWLVATYYCWLAKVTFRRDYVECQVKMLRKYYKPKLILKKRMQNKVKLWN